MSTLMSTDMVHNGKSSVRVHAPPGGGSSMGGIFGGGEPAQPAPRKQAEPARQEPVQQQRSAPPKQPEPKPEPVRQQQEQPTQQSGAHTSVRVRAPPGGKSSISFG
eukprot:TRINITY_DN5831_c0_g1_i1.p2 TRINITY_DN5831_c0_g1~~TRINITY_DN5831_c0_g1_i1.p2  ORF type:complete len:106 (-),score=35.87 TRINITY_DN5831_c0_g1_i1:39-356(-)